MSACCRAKPLKYVGPDGVVIQAPAELGEVKFQCEVYQEGSCRKVYKGRIQVTESPSMVQHILSSLSGSLGDCWPQAVKDGAIMCIVKSFKKDPAMCASKWSPDLKVLSRAIELATEFNRFVESKVDASQRYGQPLASELQFPISFASGFLFKVVNTSASNNGLNIDEIVLVEPLLNGDYVKLNSNSGWSEFDNETQKLTKGAQLAAAFSHWSWHATKDDAHQVLLCDIQGVWNKKKSQWLLTDPAAHSMKKGMLGSTDLGQRGWNKFFLHHECNDLCRFLSKPKVFVDRDFCTTKCTTMECEVPQMSSIAHSQIGGTCYAHAVATVTCAAEKRLGRETEDHTQIVERLVYTYGEYGAKTWDVLAAECGRRTLHFRKVDLQHAIKILKGSEACDGRPILATFGLSEDQWRAFKVFFSESPQSTLYKFPDPPYQRVQWPVKEWWNRDPSSRHDKTYHAVVISDYLENVLTLKNSWGPQWGDEGRFSVAKDVIRFDHLFDVYGFPMTSLKGQILQYLTSRSFRRKCGVCKEGVEGFIPEAWFGLRPKLGIQPGDEDEIQETCKDRTVPAQFCTEYEGYAPIELKDGDVTCTAYDLVSILYGAMPGGAPEPVPIKVHPEGKIYIVFVPQRDVKALYDIYKAPEFKHAIAQNRQQQGNRRRPRLVFPQF